MKALHGIAFVLLVIGGINWGLVALGGWMGQNLNVVNRLLGSWPNVEWLVYLLVGLSALVIAFDHKRTCRYCNPGGQMGM